jgi:hypothetical protein
MRLQQSDSILNMGVDVRRLALNFEPKYMVAILTTEEWTRGAGTPPAVKELVWFMDWSRMEEIGAGVYEHSVGRRLSIFLGRYASFSG